MTEQEAYMALNEILNSIDADEYPEAYSIIFADIIEDAQTTYSTPYSLACELHEADSTKLLPKCVADFIMKAYEDELANGDVDAACNIGALYYSGRCGEQSYTKALRYYTIAADGGCQQAQENLGYCYYYGRDTEVDYEKAFHYFALGAFDGHIRSLYKIGDMYRNGYYVAKNEREAFRIYRHCLETMSDEDEAYVGADIMMRIGDCYFEGIGTKVAYDLALDYYQKAERMFYDRLQEGDFLIKGCYKKVIARQEQSRKNLQESLPSYDWTN